MVKALGKQDYLILQHDYMDMIRSNSFVNGLWTVGKWFAFVSNIQNLNLELVTGTSKDVIGFTPEEILEKNAAFVTGFIHPEDFHFTNMAIGHTMGYVNSLPPEERQHIYLVFYLRAVHKNGSLVTIQNQNIPLVFDEHNFPYVFVNIITDISHLQPANIPHAVLINKKSNLHFHLDSNTLELKPTAQLFSQRELDIVRYLIRGFSSRAIAEKLFISYETVRTHRRNILQKINAKSTAELVRYVIMNKIV